MKAAFPVWNGRIAPVFDVARRLRVAEKGPDGVLREREEDLPGAADGKAERLRELAVDVLVCGAISRPLQFAVESRGVRVIPFVAGDQGEIVRAWSEGRLARPLFAMPGCRGWRRMRGRGRCGRGFMNNPTFGR